MLCIFHCKIGWAMKIRHIITWSTDTVFRCNVAAFDHMFWNRRAVIHPTTCVKENHIASPLKGHGNYIPAPTGINCITECGPLDLKKTEGLNEHICLS
jgi:hypothetical protein